jgi:hypothetical protein
VPYASRSECSMDGMTDRVRIIPRALRSIPDSGSFEVWFADGRPSQYFYWDDNPGRPRPPGRWTRAKRRKPHAPLREPSAPSWNTPAPYAMAAAGSAKRTPISHGRDRTPVAVARPARHALTATAPMPVSRRGYRKDLNRMPTKPLELPPKVVRHGRGPPTEAASKPE